MELHGDGVHPAGNPARDQHVEREEDSGGERPERDEAEGGQRGLDHQKHADEPHGTGGDAAGAFLGAQGDVWDAQWDMFLAGCGAVAAQVLLGRAHDRQLAGLDPTVRAGM